MAAATLNFQGDGALEQGVPYTLELNLNDGAEGTPNPLDLTGWTNIKAILTQPLGGSFLVEWATLVPTPSNGQIFFTLTEDQTAALPASAPGVSGLKIDVMATDNNATPIHLLSGVVQVKASALLPS